MYVLMDMGTSSTRVFLYSGGDEIGACRASFGASLGKTGGREALLSETRGLIERLLCDAGANASDVEFVMVSGMAGSEMGLCEIPHAALPADESSMAESLVEVKIPEIISAPFVFVRGLKCERAGVVSDIMRGEETELLGLREYMSGNEKTVILPGTHNKIIITDGGGRVTDFYTTMSGELLNLVIRDSILAGAVSHDFNLSELYLLKGERYAVENGVSAAAFRVRVMARAGASMDELSSFLYGAVLSEDVRLLRRVMRGDIYVGGRSSLRKAYVALLSDYGARELSDEAADGAVKRGLKLLAEHREREAMRERVIEAVMREKVISIVRAPDPETFPRAIDALYRGGIRLIEVTFDRSGKIPKEKTAEAIAYIRKTYGERMLVGAGTVTSEEDVRIASDAGAAFIISPGFDRRVVEYTRRLGLVSMPAAMTPTEILSAIDAGADFVKLFPQDALSAEYIGAVKAPISDARLIAVGGVNAENTAEILARGFVGVGVGSNLYNKKLINEGRFDELCELARAFVDAARS